MPRAICHAGSVPKIAAASAAHAIVAPIVRQSRPSRFHPAMKRTIRAGMSACMSRRLANATASAAGIAAPTSSALSTSDSRMIRPRLDPSARRIAISRSRSAARASSRFAMFAQAISSTRSPAACHSASTCGTPTSDMPRLKV